MAAVVTALAASECAVLVALVVRNRYFDRVNAAMHLPFVGAEVLHAVLWHMADPRAGDRDCDVVNRGLSWMITCAVAAFPCWSCVVCHLQRLILFPIPTGFSAPSWIGICRRWLGLKGKWTDEWERRRVPIDLDAMRMGIFVWSFGLAGGLAAYIFARNFDFGDPAFKPTEEGHTVATLVNMYFAGPFCTTVGPNGLQRWPMAVYHWLIKFAIGGLYMTILSNFNLLGRPSFSFGVLTLCGPPMMCLLILCLGDEWCSLWCSMFASLCVVYLFEPMLLDKYRVLDPPLLEISMEGQELRRSAGFWFHLAWKHVASDLLPWVEPTSGKRAEAEELGIFREEYSSQIAQLDQLGDDGFQVPSGLDLHKSMAGSGFSAVSCTVPAPMQMGGGMG